MRLRTKLRTAIMLGLPNLWRVAVYRLGIRLGISQVQRLQYQIADGPFFSPSLSYQNAICLPASQLWIAHHSYFGQHHIIDSKIPCWHVNPFNGASVNQPTRSWWQIPDFDHTLGDIKTVWEASRFDWVLTFTQHALNGQSRAIERLNLWLSDWVRCNRPYYGPNWKCGQEASIRVMHLAIAALLLKQHLHPLPPLKTLIKAHLLRIAPTIHYAIAQDNNHGTSEAAALFIGGSWLTALGEVQGHQWSECGRQWLENRAGRLIEKDGSFSQYSATYHRMMLDTYSMAEYWRRSLDLPLFSSDLYSRLKSAANWLYQITQVETGDAPNLGANDGAHLLPLGDFDYRDFRPSVQLAIALFCDRCAYAGYGSWNLPLLWLGLPVPLQSATFPSSRHLPQGGYSILRRKKAFLLFRFPRFRFRPSQADALHVDLWILGKNLLRDGGTYSYSKDDALHWYFSGTSSHNTVQFDGREQMPRLSRFLFGDWLQATTILPVDESDKITKVAAAYTDYQGASHCRKLALSESNLYVEDKVAGFSKNAVLRWRLSPGNWRIESQTVTNSIDQIVVHATVPIVRCELIDGWESRYYYQKNALPVLEIEIQKPGIIFSEFWWKND